MKRNWIPKQVLSVILAASLSMTPVITANANPVEEAIENVIEEDVISEETQLEAEITPETETEEVTEEQQEQDAETVSENEESSEENPSEENPSEEEASVEEESETDEELTEDEKKVDKKKKEEEFGEVPFQEVDTGEEELTEESTSKDTSVADRLKEVTNEPNPDDPARVIIVMEGDSVLDKGYDAKDLADNKTAMKASDHIETSQEREIEKISNEALDGKELKINYSFSILTNAVSAEVTYKDIEKIEKVDGVKAVYVAAEHEPHEVEKAAKPENTDDCEEDVIVKTWNNGLTGAGTRIAVIDTGLDLNHQAFNEGAFEAHLKDIAINNGKRLSYYNLLDDKEIEKVLPKLNAYNRRGGVTASNLYRNKKVPFAFNYIDVDFDVSHNDGVVDHGTHVAGIAAANLYVPNSASKTGYMKPDNGVIGAAPDAQLMVMKVFSENGGAYTDDYMAAIEDAILLKADAVNISFGTTEAGFSAELECYVNDIFDKLNGSSTVLSTSAGNMGRWSDYTPYGANKTGTVNLDTVGAPGSYRNALTVASSDYNSHKISCFSSVGVPDSLDLKPEITAPGGNILSCVKNGRYDYMSGTSMASPCIAAESALIQQYIRENNLAEKTGLSVRTLAQSLLMSTAEPLEYFDLGYEYSPRVQGAGQADVLKATTSPAYILVGDKEGNDGKVKAVLGDDPERTGQYSFSFDIYNLTDTPQYFGFDSSCLTPTYTDIDGVSYYGIEGKKLNPQVSFNSDNTILVYDFNEDGKVDYEDSKAFLTIVNNNNYRKIYEEYLEYFDFNKDGVLDTKDVYKFARQLNGNEKVCDTSLKAVRVTDSSRVNVTINLSDADRQYLSHYENGMYVDGFVYAIGKVNLSVPFLAFYGGWNESPMFEDFNYMDYAHNPEYGKNTYTYTGVDKTNFLTYYPRGMETMHYYESNFFVKDEKYISDRNAMSSLNGTKIASQYYTLIRNAGNLELSIVDKNTGEKYVDILTVGTAAYFDADKWRWCNNLNRFDLDWKGTDADGNPLKDGTEVEIILKAVPSYYMNSDSEYTDVPEADGMYIKMPITIDNTAPTLEKVEKTESGKYELTVHDNRYVATVLVLGADKQSVLGMYAVNQENPDEDKVVTIDEPNEEYYVKIIDYAFNTKLYHIGKESEVEDE